jgi:hypothetical protein
MSSLKFDLDSMYKLKNLELKKYIKNVNIAREITSFLLRFELEISQLIS